MGRRFRHWTPRYVWDRINVWSYEHRGASKPWLTRAAHEILIPWLRTTDVVCECGAGRSTIWFAQRTSRLISIEHDPAWHAKVVDSLNAECFENVSVSLCLDKESYVRRLSALDEGALDLCLIDGIARDECALVALSKLKTGGLLIVDNAKWFLPSNSRSPASVPPSGVPVSVQWSKFQEMVGDWRSIWTSNGVWDTAFWIKP